MSKPNYSLEIISQHPTIKNQALRKYYVEGIDTVGAWGDEPFQIKFTNNTYQRVQVKLSLDGTDILTGELASTDSKGEMWLVNGMGTLTLKAWPETNNGGAQFVFTSGEKSVAVNTHGDMSNRGIIAAAVYVEGHVEPIRSYPDFRMRPCSFRRSIVDHSTCGGNYGIWGTTLGGTLAGSTQNAGSSQSIGGTYSSNSIKFNANDGSSISANAAGVSMDSLNFSESNTSKGLESLVSVGAGQHVDQKISHVAGLIKPLFTETVRLKYMWWDDLVTKLRANNVAAPHPSGFPGDVKQKNIDLGKTPRIGSERATVPVYENYLRA